jgi:polyisoprenoid-binding protein YceI
MEKMHAAVVTSFDEPPHYQEFDVPTPRAADDHELVDVLAVGLHPRVRTDASGKHYTSTGKLPMIPGIDGVARLDDGRRVYFVADDELPGLDGREGRHRHAKNGPTSRRRRCRDDRRCDEPGDVVLGGAASPGADRGRTERAGSRCHRVTRARWPCRSPSASAPVASWVPVATLDRLEALTVVGADEIVQLTEDVDATAAALAKAAADVDIVIDYLWGKPAVQAIMALLTARADRSRALDWIQIGAVAGPTLELPSVALRSANLRIQGNGQGAVSAEGYLAELPSLIEEIDAGTLRIVARTVALRDVETAWAAPDVPGERTVIVPKNIAQTSIEFHTKAMWLFNVKGTAKALSGTGTVGADGSVQGKLVIDATSIDTKNKKRDAHLQTADFFDTANYPTIDFEVTSGRMLESGQAEVSGSLTIHGQTRPVTVVGTLELDGTSATLTTEVDDLDRKEWGLTWAKMGAGTHNRIVIQARFTKG